MPPSAMTRRAALLASLALLATLAARAPAQGGSTPGPSYPVLFVTQVPIPADFTTIGSTFGNHLASMGSVGRGGDLWIRHPDGTLRNLTQAAGYGNAGFQGAGAIAVRDPAVHWSGQKALFSMVVGAPTQQYQQLAFRWQIYEITGLGPSDTPVITLVPNQPSSYNNVTPVYGSDDRIIFTSDRPRDGAAHLYPQLDEYEEAATVSGLWRLDPASGELELLVHAPSGDFTPIVDSFGRVVFTQWDHLQRDQQADADATGPTPIYGTFNWSDEGPASIPLADRTEVFPEPRPTRTDLLAGTDLRGHRFNHFFPWMANQDGSELETLNHIGRHELHGYFDKSRNGDPSLIEFIAGSSGRYNPREIENFFQGTEDPVTPGRYVGVDAPEFGTHGAGQLVGLTIPPGRNPDQVAVEWITHRDTHQASGQPGPDHSGLYRDPIVLSDGTLIAVHTPETRTDANDGSRAAPASRYDFRLKSIVPGAGAAHVAGQPLTGGISKTISYWDPDVLVTYSGELWELDPVEVRPRAIPPLTAAPATLDPPERQAFTLAGVDPARLRSFLAANDLALIVSRDVTTRDGHDRQQPFNLRVPGTPTQTTGVPGPLYDVELLQIFQGDQLRSLGGTASPRPGRRVLAQPLHDGMTWNPSPPGAPAGSVALGPDGSMAAFVPARRALSWQLTDGAGEGIVRERYWLGFRAGEIRVCTSCHGINTSDQAQSAAPSNTPQALVELLADWQARTGPVIDPALGAGTAGAGAGGPFDVLGINGSPGGAGRRVDVAIGQPITISVDPAPTSPATTPFVVWGLLAAPDPGTAWPTPLGTFVFPPQPYFPLHPALFTLANSYFADPRASYPAYPAPWTLTAPFGLPGPETVTLQGLLDDGVASPPLALTNAIILRVL